MLPHTQDNSTYFFYLLKYLENRYIFEKEQPQRRRRRIRKEKTRLYTKTFFAFGASYVFCQGESEVFSDFSPLTAPGPV
jgi:hypothetical protein